MKKRALVVPALFVSVTLLVMSGACSQHDPGPYEGGGRTIGTTQIGGSVGGPNSDASAPDVSVSDASQDTTFLPDIVVPETGGGD